MHLLQQGVFAIGLCTKTKFSIRGRRQWIKDTSLGSLMGSKRNFHRFCHFQPLLANAIHTMFNVRPEILIKNLVIYRQGLS